MDRWSLTVQVGANKLTDRSGRDDLDLWDHLHLSSSVHIFRGHFRAEIASAERISKPELGFARTFRPMTLESIVF